MSEGAGLLAALRPALPAGITIALEDPAAGPFGLLPGEALDRAVPRRLAEFAAGRRAARAAMAMLDAPAVAIPHGPDRAPLWPDGVVGSISHAGGICLAMVGRSDAWMAVGLDIEADRALDAALWREILCPDELGPVEDLPPARRGHAAMTIFVIKEAVYKAQFPASRRLLAFQALNVDLDCDRFVARFNHDVPCFARGATISGQVCRAEGHVAAFCAIRRAPGA